MKLFNLIKLYICIYFRVNFLKLEKKRILYIVQFLILELKINKTSI